MSESAEAVAATLSSRSSRNVTIEITNLTQNICLKNPKIHLESGGCHSPPQPTVRPQKTQVCCFGKGCGKPTGSVGVLTYELFQQHSSTPKQKLALMFSVPYDYNVYKNWLGVGVYELGKEVNKSLYDEMYYNKEQSGFVREEARGCGLTFEGSEVDVKVTMSPMGRAIMKVEVWDKFFPPMGQHPV